jgi:hypothetical protein
MAPTPQFRRVQTVRFRCLAGEAQMFASRLHCDSISQPSMEVVDGDYGCNGIWSDPYGPAGTLTIGVGP